MLNGCGLVGVSYDLGMIGGCGQCLGTGFQKVGAYVNYQKVQFFLLVLVSNSDRYSPFCLDQYVNNFALSGFSIGAS